MQRALRQPAGVPDVASQHHSPAATPWATPDGAASSPGAAPVAGTPQLWSGSTHGDGGGTARTPLPPQPQFPFIPISAAALGRLPERRSGQPVTGADIMEEALVEEAVAAQAAQLMSAPGALDAAAAAYGQAQRRTGKSPDV